MFFIHLTKQNTGWLGWPLKLLNYRHSKLRFPWSMPLRPNGRIFLAFYAPSQIFFREFHKTTAWWEHCTEDIDIEINQGTEFGTLWMPMFSLLDVITFDLNGKIEPNVNFRTRLPVSNIWNNHLPWIIIPFRCEVRSNFPRYYWRKHGILFFHLSVGTKPSNKSI